LKVLMVPVSDFCRSPAELAGTLLRSLPWPLSSWRSGRSV